MTMLTRIIYRFGIMSLFFPLVVLADQDNFVLRHANENNLLTLQHALEIALAENPGLSRVGAQAQALAEVSSQVGALPDPVLFLNALNLPTDTYSLSQEAMTQMQVGIGVTLPFPGKLGLREQAADFEAKTAEFGVDETRLVLTRNVRMTWWNLFFLDRAIVIVKRNQNLLRDLIKIAQAKYKTGQGMQSDILTAQVELSKLLEAEISLHATRNGQVAVLNTLLGQPATTRVVLPDLTDESLPEAPDFASLHDMALKARPLLLAQRAQLEAAHTKVTLAEKDYYPDFKLGAVYGFRSGLNPNGSQRADMASFTFSMNLPFFLENKQNHALLQRKAEASKEQFGLQERTTQVDGEIEQALGDYRASYEQALLFKTGIIPQASQTEAAMLAAYQVDKVDFLNLLRAQVTLYNYETQYWKVLSSGWQAWARLEAAVGMPIKKIAQQDTTGRTVKEKSNE